MSSPLTLRRARNLTRKYQLRHPSTPWADAYVAIRNMSDFDRRQLGRGARSAADIMADSRKRNAHRNALRVRDFALTGLEAFCQEQVQRVRALTRRQPTPTAEAHLVHVPPGRYRQQIVNDLFELVEVRR